MIFEGMQDHTADSIKSLEGFHGAWIEEAHSLSDRSLRLLIPTIREPGSELWFSWNPDQPGDAVEQLFRQLAGTDYPVTVGKSIGAGYAIVHATYLENPFCPAVVEAEAERLKAADPESYAHVWLGGYFLGGAGRVYSSFLARPWPAGNVDEGIEDPGGTLLVGMDFNVNPMSAVVATRAVDECLIHDALEIDTSNTEEMARELRARYPDRHVVVCPDPSGSRRQTSAPVGQTDHTILKRFGFEVRAPRAAPPVVDRINNANAMYESEGRRRVRVHPRAEALLTGLGNLVYKEGTSQVDKASGFDHICDAADYLLWQEFNVLKPRARVEEVSFALT